MYVGQRPDLPGEAVLGPAPGEDVVPRPAWPVPVVEPDTAGFVGYVDAVLGRLLKLARTMTPTEADAQDVAAEALARVYASWARVSRLPHREAWVLRVAANLACDLGRRRARAGRLAGLLASWRSAPTDSSEQVANRQTLVTGLAALPPRQRQAVALHYLADLPVEEVAGAMRVTPASAKTHIHRGLVALRSRLGRSLEEGIHGDA